MNQQPSRVMVHSSPFLRCVQTAAHIAEELIGCNPKIRMDAALGEWLTPDYFANCSPPPDDNHVDLGNQAVSALQRQGKLRLVENGWNISSLGDSGSMREFWSEMHLRFEHYLKRLNGFYSKHNRKIETLIIVTHGAGVSSLLTHFCGEPVLSEIRLGSISLVSRDEEADEAGSFSNDDSASRSRASSVTNWAWLGPDQVEEKFSIGSWQLELLNVAGGTGSGSGGPTLAPGSDMNMKRRTSSPAMFMLNTTFLGSAPPSTRTSRASSVLRPNAESDSISVSRAQNVLNEASRALGASPGASSGVSASSGAFSGVSSTSGTSSSTVTPSGNANISGEGNSGSVSSASFGTSGASGASTSVSGTSGISSSVSRDPISQGISGTSGTGTGTSKSGSGITSSSVTSAALSSAQSSSVTSAALSSARTLTPSASVPAIFESSAAVATTTPATPSPPSESPDGSPTTSPQFSSGSWLLGSNRW
ncbi:hypothetical protein CKK34_5254 [Yarrowia sp. E02]|nr:hypothetical protein CKK34_5254 [Yarrowia sp. E02]